MTTTESARASRSDWSLRLSFEDPRIVLTWLVRLRWLAVIGQVLAVSAAQWLLRVELPLVPIVGVIALTALSNVAAMWRLRGAHPGAVLVPVLIVLDVMFLTVLLYCSGGSANPFASLYVVHVVMAVVALGAPWSWIIVAIAAAGYALNFVYFVPLQTKEPLPRWTLSVGAWVSLVLVGVLIAYFVGRVVRALRDRERDLQSIRERSAKNERLAALTTLAAGTAHELGTPLGTIAVVAKEMELLAEKSENASVQEDARLIRQEVERCRSILDRMRVDIVENLHQKVARVGVEELIQLFQSELNETQRGRLQISQEGDFETIVVPVRAIQQAIHVLLKNAFDASELLKPVRLVLKRDGDRAIFIVDDNGSGMSDDVLRRAGEPFFTTKPPGRGTGLGLFLVRLVAERCGGTFEIQSTPGQGTRSTLTIPTGPAT